MAITLLLLLGSALLIYFSCEFFVNGVEWVGRKLNVTQTATGTVLAAFGTALPESAITLVATAFSNGSDEKDIGVGAAIGGPLVLGTLAYTVVGIATLAMYRRTQRRRRLKIRYRDSLRLSRDQLWFLAIFVAAVALGWRAFPLKSYFGFAFLACYALYVWFEFQGNRGDEKEEGTLARLTLRPRDPNPHLGWVLVQTLVSLAVVFAASRLFVSKLEAVGPWLGLAPQVTALLLSPIATELPEITNAIIWIRQGKERLALANIGGSMIAQATVPTAFGLFFTGWVLDGGPRLAAAATIIAVLALILLFRARAATPLRLANIGWIYVAFAVALALLGMS